MSGVIHLGVALPCVASGIVATRIRVSSVEDAAECDNVKRMSEDELGARRMLHLGEAGVSKAPARTKSTMLRKRRRTPPRRGCR